VTPVELTVGVVSYNTRDLTCRCLESVRKAMHRRTGTVVLADNGSTDGTLEAVAGAFPEVVCLSFPENPGYGGALNRALARYPARFFLAMNADVLLSDDGMTPLLAYLEVHPECALVGPQLIGKDGQPQPSCKRFPTLGFALAELFALNAIWPRNVWVQRFYYGDRDLTRPAMVEAVSGAVMLLRSEAFRRIGGFDEGFRMYFEETDLCRRLRDAGYGVAFCPQATAMHWHGASTIQTSVRQVEYYLSYIRFFQKHRGPGPARVLAAAVKVSTVLRMLALPVKYPPLSRRRLDALSPKLAACRHLLGAIHAPAIVDASTERLP
jgi:GT2 family glycosyltransferase